MATIVAAGPLAGVLAALALLLTPLVDYAASAAAQGLPVPTAVMGIAASCLTTAVACLGADVYVTAQGTSGGERWW